MNKQSILDDLRAFELRQHEIAQKHSVSVKTVARLAKEYQLQKGRGRLHSWTFEQSSSQLAYIIGAYITDGTLRKEPKHNRYNALRIDNTNMDFLNHIYQCMEKCELHPKWGSITLPNDSHKGSKTKYALCTYVSMFSQWVNLVCEYKSHIPKFLFDASKVDKLAFLAGAIDGDGSVSLGGIISISGTDNWLDELASLLESIGIKTSGRKFSRVLASGKVLYRISINRKDFVAADGWCVIDYKQNRILNARDVRERPNNNKKKYICPVCGEIKLYSRNPKQCRDCYLKSEGFHQHLVNIASKGNFAANKARWGK